MSNNLSIPERNVERLRELLNLINETTGSNDTTLTDAVDSLVDGFGQGGGSGEDVLQYATGLDSLFDSTAFPTGYELTLNVPNFKESANRLLRYATGISKVTLKGNIANNSVTLQYAFNGRSNGSLNTVDFSEWGNGEIKPTYINNGFADQTYLHSIIGIIDWSSAVNVNAAFQNCKALQNITFKENSLSKSISLANSSLLSDASIQSIINGLADLTGQTSQTLTLHADVKAKLVEAQLTTITSKNWTLA